MNTIVSPVHRCERVLPGGRRCGRSAADGESLCWFHGETRPMAMESETNGSRPEPAVPREALLAALRRRIGKAPERIPELAATGLSKARELLSARTRDLSAPLRGIGAFVGERLSRRLARGVTRRRPRPSGIDEFGFDEEHYARLRPLLRFLYRRWFHVDARGLEHVPERGKALLVASSAGAFPWDGAMIATALAGAGRSTDPLRGLYPRHLASVPFLATILHRSGLVPASPENMELLLSRDERALTFLEGPLGRVSRLGRMRHVVRLGRCEFAQVAIRTGAPIIPVLVTGSEGAYPLLARSELLGRLVGLKSLPITPTFPWLGPLGLLPLPSRWRILFDQPIETASLGALRADDFLLVSRLAGEVRDRIEGLKELAAHSGD